MIQSLRHHTFRLLAWKSTVVLLMVVFNVSSVLGQEVGGAVEEPKGAIDPFGAGARPVEKAKADAPTAAAKAEPLAIDILRGGNPETPVDLLRAAKATLEFGRPDECKRYLAKLLGNQPKDETLAAQTLQFGDFLFRLSRHKEVQPEGKQVADLIFAAGQKVAENSEHVGELIGKLSATESNERQSALVRLSQAGESVIPPLLSALADVGREKEHVYIQAALVRLAGVSLRPLLGALEAPDAAFKARVIETLGHIRSSRSAVYLVRSANDPEVPPAVREAAIAALRRITGAVPDVYEARSYLAREVTRLWQGELPVESDAVGLVAIWSWDATKGTVSSRKLPKADAAASMAAAVAADLYALSPADAAAERLMLLTSLEAAKSQAGLDVGLPLEAGSAGVRAIKADPQVISLLVADALRQARIPATLAAIEVLAKIGDVSVLSSPNGVASPLAEALTSSDRRVRFAAAMAAAKLAPGGQFVGASRVSSTLRWLAGAQGINYVLVADPRVENGQNTIALANSAGFEGLVAHTGRELFAEAVKSADLEFILIDDAIDSPPVLDLVQWLRRDFRTARIPVGVMARTERLDALQRQFAEDAHTIVFPRLHSEATAFAEIARLKAIAGRNFVGADERLKQAREASEALARVEALAAARNAR